MTGGKYGGLNVGGRKVVRSKSLLSSQQEFDINQPEKVVEGLS